MDIGACSCSCRWWILTGNNTCNSYFIMFEAYVHSDKLILIFHKYLLCARMCGNSFFKEGSG